MTTYLEINQAIDDDDWFIINQEESTNYGPNQLYDSFEEDKDHRIVYK